MCCRISELVVSRRQTVLGCAFDFLVRPSASPERLETCRISERCTVNEAVAHVSLPDCTAR